MLTLEAPRAQQFVRDIEAAFTAAPPYQSLDPFLLDKLPSDEAFKTRRRLAVQALITANGEKVDPDSHAFMAEWASYISLMDPLAQVGFSVDLAPQQFESGRPGRHGIDLVVAHEKGSSVDPILGINIKLQRLKETTASDSHRYDPAIQGPSLNMSLGNWAVQTREQEQVDIRRWIESLAVPHAVQTGKIPYIPALRRYIVQGIFSTLNIYTWKWDQYSKGSYALNESQQCLVPYNVEEHQIFESKLMSAHKLFEELNANLQVM